MGKRILMLLSNGLNPDIRVYKEAKSLVNHGFEVTVLCWDRECNLPLKEEKDGIQIIRIRTNKVKNANIISLAKELPKFYKKIILITKKLNFDYIHCHDFDTVYPGLKLKSKYQVPVTYDIHDLYESYLEKNKFLKTIVHKIDTYYCKRVDNIIIVNDDFKNKPQIKNKKTITIMNTPSLKGSKKTKTTSQGLFYAGGLMDSREMSFIFKSNVKEKITIAGKGPLYNKYKKAFPNVNFLGQINPEEVEKRTSKAKIIIAPYNTKYPNNRLASPNKLFDAMKYGKPVLVSDKTVMGKIVKQTKCGETFEYNNSQDFTKKLNKINKNYNKYSNNSYNVFAKKYSWEIMEKRLIKLYGDYK